MSANRNSSWMFILLGCLATGTIIFAVPVLLLTSEQRSPHFWHRVCWTEFLGFLIWGYFGWFRALAVKKDEPNRGAAGIAPSIGIVISAYAVCSFGLMSAHALLPSADFLDRFHLAGQIVIAAVSIIVLAFLQLAWRAHSHSGEDSMTPPT